MLAIDGGEKVRKTPFPSRRLFGEEEKQAAVALFDKAIESGGVFGYGGPEEQAYEREFAEFLGGGYADLVNSGTASIYTALGALQLDAGSEVVIPPITDPGGAMPVPLLNCIPTVADAHPGSYNMGPDELKAALTPHTRAIIVAHIAGEPADMDPIMEIARSRGIPVIEDCAQAHAARYKGRFVGTIGDLGAFSTMSGKHHATGAQGGVVFTRNEELYWRAKRFSDRGKPFNTDSPTNVVAGLNLNGNDLSAAIGRAQLRKLPGITARRRKVVNAIHEGLAGMVAVSAAWEPKGAESVYWFLRIKVNVDRIRVDKNTFAKAVGAEGISVNPTYRHIPSEARWFRERSVFGRSGYPWTCDRYKGDRNATFPCPNAVEATETHFNISVHENYGDQEVKDILEAFRKVEKAYLK